MLPRSFLESQNYNFENILFNKLAFIHIVNNIKVFTRIKKKIPYQMFHNEKHKQKRVRYMIIYTYVFWFNHAGKFRDSPCL